MDKDFMLTYYDKMVRPIWRKEAYERYLRYHR